MKWQSLFGFGLIGSTALLWATGCAPPAVEVPPDFRLEYSRGPCEGFCADYSVSVDAVGRANWLGKSSVKHKGPAMKTLSPAAVREIAAALDSLHVKGVTKEIRCLDSPILSIAVTMNKTTASVQAQPDCGGSSTPMADRVFKIVKILDQIVGVEPWVGTLQANSQ